MNELPVIGPCVCPKISWIETGQTLQAAKGCSTSKKPILEREINAFSLRFYHKWIKIMLIRRNCKFLFLFPYVTRNIPICYTKYIRNIPMNVSCVRFIVKSSSCNGRDISQN